MFFLLRTAGFGRRRRWPDQSRDATAGLVGPTTRRSIGSHIRFRWRPKEHVTPDRRRAG